MDDDTPAGSTGPVADRMQALLSRAVEEQVSEQRTVSAVLTELRQQVGSLVEGAPTATDLAGLETAVRSVVSDLRTATTLLGQRLDALGSRVDDLGRSSTAPVEATATGLSELGHQVAAQADAVGRLTTTFGEVDGRLAQIGERLSDIGDAAGGVPAVATDLARLAERVDALAGLHHEVALVTRVLTELREDPAPRSLALGLEGLREDVDALSARLADRTTPGADEVAALVAQQVTDRLVGTLAPQVAEVVLAQLVQALVPQVRSDTAQIVEAAAADSEARLAAHVDDAVLALAEALLRRRRSAGQGVAGAVSAAEEHEPLEEVGGGTAVASGEGPAEEPGSPEDDGSLEVDGSVQDADLLEEASVGEMDVEEVDEDGQPIEAVLPASERDTIDEGPDADAETDADVEIAADDDTDVGDGREPAPGAPSAATPVPPAPYVRPTVDPAPGRSGKRRPWWRPGG